MPEAEPTFCRPAAYEFFAAQLPQLNDIVGLFNAALAVSMHELTDVDPRAVRARLDSWAQRVRGRVRGDNPQAILAHLHTVLFEEEGLRGNTQDYYQPANSYISQVLETRQGIPITLTLIYKYVAQQLGLTVHGVNAPAHFLACVQMDDSWTLVDPFFGGRILTRQEAIEQIQQATGHVFEIQEGEAAGLTDPFHDPLFEIANHTQWLARIIRNLRSLFQQLGRERDVRAMMELFRLL